MTHKEKRFILIGICAILSVLCLSAASFGTETEKDLIRFHVIANSDSVFDQSVKLAVRDGVIDEINGLLINAQNAEEAEAILKANEKEIIKTANAILKKYQCGYEARGVLGTSKFPTKTYGDITLAAGEYNAFRIILGEGKGKNWWCVLYPPLCFVDIKDDTAVAVTTTEEMTETEKDTIAVKGELFQIKIRSKLLEWLP